MARIAGSIELGVGPSLRGFQSKLNADLKKVRAGIDVPVNPSLKKASAELAAFRKRQEANAINLRVDIDQAHLRRQANQTFRQVEHIYKRSSLSKAIRINVVVAGATALPALAQGALSATAAITDLGRAVAILPGLFSSMAAAVGTVMTGMRGIGDAFKAAGTNAKDAARNQQDYEKASRDLARAQRDVVQALKDANRQIQDQKDALRQGALSVEQAQLNVDKANERLRKGGFDTFNDYRQAVLDAKQAQLDLSTAVKENSRNIQDYYDNATKGARNTDTFRDALDRLSDTVDRFSEAQDKVSGKTSEFLEALANLSPAAQDFVTKVRSLEGAWKNLQNAVQDKMFQGLGDQIVDLANRRLPLLQRGMERVAQGLNTNFKQVLDAIGSDQNSEAIAKIFERTGRALELANPGIESFINAFVRISEAGSRFLPRLARSFNQVMDRFEAFIQRADEDGSLENWIDRGLDLLSSLGRSLGHIGSILGSVTRAYEAATGNVGGFATTMEKGLGKLADFLASPAGQDALIGYLQDAKLFLDTIKEALPGIIDGFQSFADGARAFAEVAFPIFAELGRFLRDHIELVKTLFIAWAAWKTVRPFFDFGKRSFNQLNKLALRYKTTLQGVEAAHKQIATAAQEAADLERRAFIDRAKAQAALSSVELNNASRMRQARDELQLREQAHEQAVADFNLAKQAQQTNKDTFILESDLEELRKRAAADQKAVETERAKNTKAAQASLRKEIKDQESLLITAEANARTARDQAEALKEAEAQQRLNADPKKRPKDAKVRDALIALGGDPGQAPVIDTPVTRQQIKEAEDAAKAADKRVSDVARRLDQTKARLETIEVEGGQVRASTLSRAANSQALLARAEELRDIDLERSLASLEDVRQKELAVKKAREDVRIASLNVAATERATLADRVAAQENLETANRNLKTAVDDAAEANQRLVTQVERANRPFARLRDAIGNRGRGVVGALQTLVSSMGSVLAGIGSVGLTVGLIYGLDQLTAAHNRAEEAAAAQKETLDALHSTMAEGTGAATNETLRQNLEQLRNHVNPVHADDRGQDFDAAAILEGQLGIKPNTAAALSLPTAVAEREQALQPSDERIIAAVPGLQEWKVWGDKYKENGVDERVYGKALNGDPESIGKVEAARRAISGPGPLGLNVATGQAPNDLGHAQEQLPRSGPNGGLRGLSLATGALRDVGNQGVAAGQKEQGLGAAINQPGLNQQGQDLFGPYGIAPNGVVLNADGSVSIALDRLPNDGWIETQRDNGISVTPRPTGPGSTGANITLDQEAAKKYLNTFATGGFVSGPGGPKSDMIPALLSNGEFVMNADAVKRYGEGVMHAMNGGLVPKFDTGGPVKPPFVPAIPGAAPVPIYPERPSGPPVKAPGVGDYLSGAASQVLGGLGLPKPDVHPLLKGRTNLVADAGKALAGQVIPGLDRNLPGSGTMSEIPTGGRGNGPHGRTGSRFIATPKPPAVAPGPVSKPSAPKAPDPVFSQGNQWVEYWRKNPQFAPPEYRGTNGIPAGGAHAPGGNFQPGPSGASSAPGVPGVSATPTSPVTPRPAAPTPLQPGQIPTYEQLNSGTTAAAASAASAAVAALPEDLRNLVSNPASRASSFGPIDITPSVVKDLPKLFNPAEAVSGTSKGIPQWLIDLTKRFGLNVVTRPDGKTLHEAGFAVDIFDPESPGGPSEKMDQLAEFLYNNLGAQSLQLIYSGTKGQKYGIAGGTKVGPGTDSPNYYAANWAGHADHIHWATDVAPILGDGSQIVATPPGGGGSSPNYVPVSASGGSTPPPPGPVEQAMTGDLQGPFGQVPFNGFDLLNNIGRIILGAIGAFFGIDLTSIFDTITQIVNPGEGKIGGSEPPADDYQIPPDPGPDQQVIQDLVNQASDAKAAGDEKTARALLDAANDYKNRSGGGQTAAAGPSTLGSLTGDSSKDDIAKAILTEALNRGYSRDQATAILSTALQESGLNPSIPGGGGAWIGIFQQDTSYPGRHDPNENIRAFFDRLGSKGGPNGDIWKNIFWLQQRPGEKSADSAFANGRQAYLSEIQSQLGVAQEMAGRLGFASGGFVRGPGGPRSDSIPALLSNGEFVMNAAAVKSIGVDQLKAMNAQRFNNGGAVGWFNQPIPPGQSAGPLPPPAPAAPAPPQPPAGPAADAPKPEAPKPEPVPGIGGAAGADLETGSKLGRALGEGLGQAAGGVLAPKGASSGGVAGGQAPDQSDPRGILGAAPASQEHTHPALKGGIEGAFNALGAIAGTAAGAAVTAGIGAGTMGAGAAAAGPAGAAASQLTAAGFQMAGKVASGFANILSSLAVGTVTGGTTGQGYGAPLLKQQPEAGVRNFQSIHNGNIVTNNLEEYSRLRDRKDAQRALPFLNRVG